MIARVAVSLVTLSLVIGATRDASAGTAAAACQQHVLSAASRLYQQSYGCWATGLTNFRYDVLGCLTKAETRFRNSYAAEATRAARARSQCGLRMDVESLLRVAAGDVDGVTAGIAETADFSNLRDLRLRAKRIKAASGFASQAFAAYREFAARGLDARLQTKLAAARTRLVNVFAGAQKDGGRYGLVYDGTTDSQIADALGAAADLWTRLTRPDNGAFTLAGTAFAAEATFVDFDVNDTSTSPISNDQLSTAQPMPVPSTVGGYVNLHGFGPSGNSFTFGDEVDYYVASLHAGQVVLLVLGDDPNVVDLDLCLIRPGISQDCTYESDSVEMLTAPADGTYFIKVFPFSSPLFGCSCGGTYTLSIGQAAPAALLQARRSDVEFVPGQVIVTLKDSPAALGPQGALRAHPKAALPADIGLETVAGDSARELLVQLPAGAAAKAKTFQALGVASQSQSLGQSLSADELARRETLLARKALRRRPEVASAELNTILHPSAEPNDPYYALQWHYPLIHLPQAWELTHGDPSVIVAVVDTGVRFDHPDLQGVFVPGYDFVSDPTRARDGDGIDANPSDPGDRGAGAGRSSFHGTHVAGTIAAETNNGVGVAGVSWGARVMPVRVLGMNGGTLYDVMQGVRWAAGLDNDSGTLPTQRADIINLSLGGGSFSNDAQAVFNAARDAGVIVVAAAGNSASNVPSYPASYAGVVSVAAVDMNRNPAPYSNFGPAVDVAAPGGDTSVDRNGDGYGDGVLSTLADDSVSPLTFVYGFYQGTSMATPHVAGVFALMRSVAPLITPAQIDSLLEGGLLTEDLLSAGRDDLTGWGLIDAHAAVVQAGAMQGQPAVPLSVTPKGLNFGLAVDSLDFLVENTGTDPLTVSSVATADPAPWLTITATSVGATGLGAYRATVSRDGEPGTYSATILVVSDHGTASVPVVMRIGGATSSDAGYHYILLVDAQSLTPISEVREAAANGAYPFAFSSIPDGEYLVIAGSDMDNDGLICDGGEACGSYPTLGLPEPIPLHADVSGVDFGTAFRQSLSSGANASDSISTRGLRHGSLR